MDCVNKKEMERKKWARVKKRALTVERKEDKVMDFS